MRKKLLVLSVLAMLFCLNMNVSAQLSIFTETFESGMPTGWTVDPASVATPWTVSSSGLTGVTAYGGSNYLSLYTTDQQSATKLVSPLMDATSLTQPEMRFYLMQKARGQNTGYARDTLRVYARNSATANWVLVDTKSAEISVWTLQTVDLSQFAAGNLQIALEYVYGAGLGIGIDNMYVGDPSVCFTPNNLQAYRVTHNSAELMWTAYETAFQFGLKVSTTPLANPGSSTANIVDQTVFFKPYTVTGLTPSTTYYFYVSADCGNGDESSWSAAGQFTTKCAPVTLPFTQGFETSGDFTTCWTREFVANGVWTSTPAASTYQPKSTTSYHHAGSSAAQLYGYYYVSGQDTRSTQSWIASPELNTTSITDKQISFWAYTSSIDCELRVGVMSDPSDPASFEEVTTIQPTVASQWQEFVLPMNGVTNTAARYVAFMVDGNDFNKSFYYYVDDVEVSEIPLCPKASVVKAENVSGNSATITWLGTATTWNIKVSTTALTNPATQTGNVLNTQIGASPYQLTGLTPKTRYYVYLQPDCSAAGNGQGPWSTEMSFSTTQVPATVPYSCDFEDAEVNQWDLINGTQTNKWVINTAAHNGEGTHALYISDATTGTTRAHNYTVSSAVSYVYALRTIHFDPGVYEINFDWTGYGEGNYDLLRAFLLPASVTPEAGNAYGMTSTTNTDPQGWISLSGPSTKLNLKSTWESQNYMLTVTDTINYNLVFFWKNDGSAGTQPPAAVDNITITPFTCAPPSNLTTGVAGQSSFTATWTPSPLGETQWEAQLVLGGTAVVDTVVSTPSITFTGLSASTTYSVRVRSVCGAGDYSAWVSAAVTTACGDITALPYVEDFESAAYGSNTGSFPTCWIKAQAFSTSYPYCSTSYNHTNGGGSGKSLYFYYYSSGTNVPNIAVLPRVNVPGKTIQDLQISFAILYSSTTVYNLTVGVMDHPDSINSFTPVTVVRTAGQTGVWAEYDVSFAGYTGNGQYIAFSDMSSTSSYNYVYLDDVVLNLAPSCPKPMGFRMSGVTENSVSLAWDSVPGVSWQVAVTTANGSLDNPVATRIVSVPHASVNGLAGLTNYKAYVRAICGAGDTSAWTSSVSFATTAVPETLPLVTDFSNNTDNAKWQFANGTQTNKWVIGNATGSGDSKSMYISNTNGTTAAYEITSASYVFAYRLVKFTPGIYEVSFDWKGGGESSIDYMKAYLAPANETFTAGSGGKITSATVDPADWISLNGTKGYLNDPTATSVNWKNVSETLTFTDTTNMYIVFYWRDDTSIGTQPGACVDNLSISALACSSVATVTRSDNSAIINLTPTIGTPIAYEVVVNNSPINFNNLSNVMHHRVLTNGVSTDTITGLASSTQYYAYTRTICTGNDTGRWAACNFKTVCSYITIPYTWDFENSTATGSGSVPDCWTRPSNGYSGYPYVYSSTTYAHSGQYCLYFYSPYSTTTNYAPTCIASPIIPVANIADYRVSFTMRYSSAGAMIVVGVMTNPDDVATFVPVDTVTLQEASVFEEHVVHLRNYTGNGKYVAFYADANLRGAYNYLYIDDITIEEDRLCVTPDNVTATQITGNGAYISWGANNGLTFDFLMTTEEVDPDTITGTEASVFMYEEQLTDPYLDLSGYLSVNQTYWVYVKADCNAADGKTSLWSQPGIFTTACTAQALPYATNFNIPRINQPNTVPTCWNTMYESVGSLPTGNYTYEAMCQTETSYRPDSTVTDSAALRLYGYYSTTASSKVYAALPEFNGSLANYKLSFEVAQSSTVDGIALVGLMSDASDGSTFTPFDTIRVKNIWTRYEVSLANLQMNTGDRLAILVDGDLNQRAVTFYIDDLRVEQLVPCQAPSNMYVGDLGGATPYVSLHTLHPADSLIQLQITRNGYLPSLLDSAYNAGLVVYNVDTVVNINNFPFRVPAGVLDGLTQYYLYARVVCDAANNQYSDRTATTFTTGCVPANLPYSYSFEDATASSPSSKPTCWTSRQDNGATSYPYTSSSYAKTGTYSLYFYGSSTYRSYGVLPQMAIDSIQKTMITFSLYYSTTNSYQLELGVMTDPMVDSTFTSIGFFTNANTGWNTFTVPLNTYTGNGKYIAFRTAPGVTTATSCYLYLDDVVVEEIPSCFRPTNVQTTNILENAVSFSWLPGASNETSWEYVVVPHNAPVTAATPVATTTATATVTGLTPATDYDIYVRAICSATDQSGWSEVYTFRTMNQAERLPLNTNFSDPVDNARWTFANGTQANKWVINNNYGTNGAGALFISNDNGTTNSYTNTSTTAAYAYRTFRFIPDTYTISYDWMCDGESSYDGLRLFFTPITPVAGNAYGMSGSTNTVPTGWTSISGTALQNDQTSWQHFTTTFTVTDTTVYNVVFFWKNDASAGDNPAATVDNFSISGTHCMIQGVTAVGSAGDAITVQSVNSDADSYQIFVADSIMSQYDIENATPTAVTDSFPVVINGLEPSTLYYVFVQGICGTDGLTNIGNTTVRTLCAAVNVNDSVWFTENFDSDGTGTSAHPGCWTTGTNYTTTAYPYISTTHSNGVGSLYFYGTSTYYSYAATPQLVGTPINELNVSFKGRASSVNYRIEVGVMTDPTDVTTFVPCATIAPTAASTWEQVSVNLNTYTGAGQYVAFRIPNNISSYYYIDEVVIKPMPQCAEPTVSVSITDYNDVDLNIVPARAGDTSWDVFVTAASTAANPDTTAAVFQTTTTNTTVNITTLAANTSYSAYVRTSCGSQFYRVDFKTPCLPFTITTTDWFTEDFDSDGTGTSAHPSCWTTATNYSTAYPYISTTHSNGVGSLYFYGTSTYYSYAATPRLLGTPANELNVSFKGRTTSLNYRLEVGVMTDPTDLSTFVSCGTVAPTVTSTWEQVSVNLNTYTGAGQFVAFRMPSNMTSYYYIDELVIKPMPQCAEPTVSVSIVDYNNVNLNIVPARAGDTSWDVFVTAPSTAANPDTTAAVFQTTATNTTVNITTLAANTSYSAYVRTSCGSTFTRVDFKTPCLPVTVDNTLSFTESFDNDGTGNTAHPSCWVTKTNYSTAYPYISSTHHSGVGSLYFYGSTSYYSYAATPRIIGTPMNQLRVNFWGYKSSAAYQLQVGVMTDPFDESTFEEVATVSPTATSTWTEYTIDFNTYTGTGQFLAFRAPMGASDYFYIDDLVVTPMPACSAPVVTATATSSQVNVQLTQTTATPLPIEVIVTNATTPDTTGAVLHTVTTNNSVVATGVAPGFTYNVFARALCDSVNTSTWASASVLIPVPADSLPLSATFEVASDNAKWEFASNNTGSSRWVIGGDPNAVNGGSSALYISGNGSTFTYNSEGAVSIAYRRIHVPAGTYLVNYDWLCEGESSFDYLHVFLAPASIDISTITSWNSTTGAPTGCTALDGGNKLNLSSTAWTTYSNMHTFTTGDYLLVFYWRDDSSVTHDPPAAVDNVFMGTLKYATITDSVCDGYNYQGNGFTIPSTDITLGGANNFQRLQNDTMLTLHLVVVPSAETVFNETICAGTTYNQNGFNTGNAGTYHRYLTSAFGCDSIVTLNLTVTQGFRDVQSMTICQSQTPYLWNGQSISTTGQYTHTVSSPDGCDSTFVLNLIVTPAITVTVNDAICQGDSYTWNGQTYNAAGTYTWTGTAANGCDSIVTLHLTVNPTYNQNESLTIDETEVPYTWNGIVINAEGLYTWNGTTAAGCDSIIVLDLRIKGVGIDYAEDGMFAISPNPVQRGGNVRLDVTLSEAEREGLVVEVYTSNGKLVDRFEPKEQPMYAKMPDVDGLYMIRLTTGTGRVMYGKVIVK